jgi:hypothetical protein
MARASRLLWLALVLPLAGCGRAAYDFLAVEDCLQRADVKFDDVTGKIADGGDGTLQWAGLKTRRRGNVFMAWYRDPPPATKRQIDGCLTAARDHSVS